MLSEINELRKKILEDEYSSLNTEQRQAVFAYGNPLLILAGAGSGKTTVIVNKIGYLIKYGNTYATEYTKSASRADVEFLEECLSDKRFRKGAKYEELMCEDRIPPQNLLAITFTNKAANEMRERIERIFDISASELWALTFHSFCVRILRRYITRLGFSSDFTIYDDADSSKLLSAIMKPMELDDRYNAKLVSKIISSAKTNFLTPDEFIAEKNAASLPKMGVIYSAYQAELRAANALDFDDLIFYAVQLLSDYPEVRKTVNDRFKYVLVDEYQDTNPLQSKLVTLLAPDGNVCVVGDDDQSIYRFMGATVENILAFDRIYGNAEIIRLEQNYRSTSVILDAANSVIKNNEDRKGKNLWTDRGTGAQIKYNILNNHYDEAEYIAKSILADSSTKKLKFSDFCVLYRTHSQSNPIEMAMKGNGIPYRVFGGLAFLKRKEIQDILAYLNVVHNPNDKTRLLRIVNEPKRGIGETTMNAVVDLAAKNNVGIFDIMLKASDYAELQRPSEKLQKFADMVTALQAAEEEMKLSEFCTYMMTAVGYTEMINKLDTSERAARNDNLQELINMIVKYETEAEEPTLSGFLEDTALVGAIDNYSEGDDAVVLMTMHCAKGLEFDTVFISGFEEGLFPSSMSTYEPGGVEEERRLCYVAITRAKTQLYIVSARSRMMYGSIRSSFPSRFIKEIPEQLIQNIRPVYIKKQAPTGPKKSAWDIETRTTVSVVAANSDKKSDGQSFTVGMRVKHKVFGEGTVTEVKGITNDTLLSVSFDTAGDKKLMANYAKLEIL